MRFPWPSLKARLRRALLPQSADGWLLQEPLEDSFAREVAVRMKVPAGKAKVSTARALANDQSSLDGVFEFDPAIVRSEWPTLSRRVWANLRTGGFFAAAIEQESHLAIALATAHGWLTCQCVRPSSGKMILVLQKPLHGQINRYDLDPSVEVPRWQKFPSPAERQKHLGTAQGSAAKKGARRCHIIGCSIAKSGTSSLAGLFSQYRSRHEFEAAETIRRMCDSGGDLAAALGPEWVRQRDQRAGLLECDSSQLHHWYLPALVQAFPEALFIVTIRDPKKWLTSILNHRLARGRSPEWEFVDLMRFGQPCQDATGPESVLAYYGLPGLSSFLKFWVAHHARVLADIPLDKLLILPLSDLDRSAPTIAAFAGVPENTLTPASARLNEARADFHLLDRFEEGHIERLISGICGPTWEALCGRMASRA